MAKSYKNFSSQLKSVVKNYSTDGKSNKKITPYLDDLDANENLRTEEFERKMQSKRRREMY